MTDFKVLTEEETKKLSTRLPRNNWEAISEVVASGKGIELGPYTTWAGADNAKNSARSALTRKLRCLDAGRDVHIVVRRTSDGWVLSIWSSPTLR
ncbi:MAG: hypothetical protein WC565_08195 [Parcubacteria group bacterium]